jgi:hypothetical protein
VNWYYYFVYRCDPPPHWVPAFVKGPEWKSESDARNYAENLTYYSGMTQSAFIVNTWRLENGGWRDLGWSAQSCPPL